MKFLDELYLYRRDLGLGPVLEVPSSVFIAMLPSFTYRHEAVADYLRNVHGVGNDLPPCLDVDFRSPAVELRDDRKDLLPSPASSRCN